jgi:hypothetical protein
MERDTVALLESCLAPSDDGRVVAAYLGGAGAVGSGAVEVVEDERIERSDPVVGVSRADVDAEGGFLGRGETQGGVRAEEDGADVQEGFLVVGRDVLGVHADGHVYCVEEDLFGEGWEGYMSCGVCHTSGVELWTEDEDLILWRSESWSVQLLI